MLDKLVQALLDFIELFYICRVVDQYDRGCRLRFGKHVGGTLQPGLHFQFPFLIDEILVETVVTKTLSLGIQSLESPNGKTVAFQAVIQYTIEDVTKALLTVEDHQEAVSDRCSGVIRPTLSKLDHDVLMDLDLDSTNELLRPVCRKVTTRWGINITNVSLPDLTTVRNIRLLQE